MTDLHPDHLRLLSLARASFQARDNRQLWRQNTERATAEHGVACDELWNELERQVAVQDGRVPVAALPAVRQQRMIAQMRSEIVAVAQTAIIDAMEELARGPWMEDDR